MMRFITLGLSLAFSLLLAACSSTVTSVVQGFVPSTNERFQGTATGYMDQSGVFTVTSTKGTVCQGKFVYITSRYGKGTMECNDGRIGSFDFASAGRHGTGDGKLGEKPFTFTFSE